jgi:hypothetical protein
MERIYPAVESAAKRLGATRMKTEIGREVSGLKSWNR